jgi:hemerythrin superfamily protein
MNALNLLQEDHHRVNELFDRYQLLHPKEADRKRELAAEIIRELSIHASIEEQLFYPTLRKKVARKGSAVLRALEEHHLAKWILSEIQRADPHNERFDAKMGVLITNVREHVREEEEQLFPALREALSESDLEKLGDLLARAKRLAPTRPHPYAPDTPPANVVVGIAAGLVDKTLDLGRSMMHGKMPHNRGEIKETAEKRAETPAPRARSTRRRVARARTRVASARRRSARGRRK